MISQKIGSECWCRDVSNDKSYILILPIPCDFVDQQNMDCNCDHVLSKTEVPRAHYDNCNSVWQKTHPDKRPPKSKDGVIQLPNDNLLRLSVDVLYHLGLDTLNYDLPAMFQDVKFVCMGGTKHRMREFSEYIAKVLRLEQNVGEDLIKHSQRYAMFKAGPVLSLSHGIGIPSMTTALQEVIKLLCYAKCKDPIIFRIGTSGGLKIPAGSVVVSEWGLNGNLEKTYDIPILGKTRKIPAVLDERVSQEVASLTSVCDDFTTYVGGTMGADDFYRGQARLDGPLCDHTEAEKLEFLNKLADMGVKNIEMEAPAFAAITSEVGIRSGIVCVTYLNRLEGDQMNSSKEKLAEWQKRPMIVVGRYIEKYFKRTTI